MLVGCLVAVAGLIGLAIVAAIVTLAVFWTRSRDGKLPPEGPGAPLAGRRLVAEKYDPNGGVQRYRSGDAIEVRIPAGATSSTSTLEIVLVDAPPAAAFAGLRGGPAYEVTLGQSWRFAEPLTIELEADRERVAASRFPQPLVGYWDSRQALWHFEDVTYDAAAGKATIHTRHLTAWRLFYLELGYEVMQRADFSVVYEPKTYPIIGFKQHEPEVLATMVLDALAAAKLRFVAAGFRVPTRRTWVFLDPQLAESERGSLTGHIRLRMGPYDDATEVAHEAAHEYFHAVQNVYLDMYAMDARRWWMEATAEYGATVGTGSEAHLASGVDGTWLTKPLDTRDRKLHEYVAASFVRHLAHHDVPFRGLWEATAHTGSSPVAAGAMTGASGSVLQPLRHHVQTVSGRTLLDHYEQFARWTLFDTLGPSGAPRPWQWCAGKYQWNPGSSELKLRLNLEPGYTAKAACVELAGAAGTFSVRLTRALPADTTLKAYVLPLQQRTPNPAPVANVTTSATALPSPGSGMGLAVVGVNGAERAVELDVVLSQTSPVGGLASSLVDLGREPTSPPAQADDADPILSVPGLVLFAAPRRYDITASAINARPLPRTASDSPRCAIVPGTPNVLAIGETANGWLLVALEPQWRVPGDTACRSHAFIPARYATRR